jgi:hypothetical protein
MARCCYRAFKIVQLGLSRSKIAADLRAALPRGTPESLSLHVGFGTQAGIFSAGTASLGER